MQPYQFKLAAYLDELSGDTTEACQLAAAAGFKSVCLKKAWNVGIGTATGTGATDAQCQRHKEQLSKNGLNAQMVHTDIGDVPAEQLLDHLETAKRAIDIANFFGAKHIRFGTGNKPLVKEQAAARQQLWFSEIEKLLVGRNITPLLEVTPQGFSQEPAEIAALLNENKKWQLLYDPALLLINRRIDPFVKFWSLLKGRTGAIDLRDLKIGVGPRPVGHGDCRCLETLQDAANSHFDGFLYIEPGLGRRYSNAGTLAKTFAIAMETINQALAAIIPPPTGPVQQHRMSRIR